MRIRLGIAFMTLMFLISPLNAQVMWSTDKAHSEIQFKVKHLVITTVTGEFKEFNINLNSKTLTDFNDAKLEAVLKSASIFTDNERRDNHLRSDDFLNAEKFPEIKFVAVSFKKQNGNNYKVIGDLTIRDVTRSVELNAEMSKPKQFQNKHIISFHVTGEINRFDYNVKFAMADAGGGLIADKIVKFEFNLEMYVPDAEKRNIIDH